MPSEWDDPEDADRIFAAIDAAWVAPPERLARIHRLFLEKLAERRPDHPWVRRVTVGNWAITIQGVGCHHNKDLATDANRMSRKFVKELKAAGHVIERADFTFGAKEDLADPGSGFAHADDRE